MALVIPAFILIRLAYLAYERRRGSGIDDGLAGLAPQFRRLGGHLFAAGAAGCLVLVPLMRFAYDRPASFLGRTLSRVTAEEHPLMESPLLQLPANVKNALLMFNYTSDSAWFHSPAGYPALETVGGALVVLGAVLMLLRAAHGDWRGLAFLVAVPLLLLSSAMALAFPSENPSLTRSAGAIPVVVVMAALPLAFLGQRLRDWGGAWGSVAFMALCLPLFVWMGSNTQTRYFVKYREQYDNSTPNTSEMAEVINGFVAMGGDRDHAYIVSWSNGPDYRAIGQLIGDIHWPNNLFDVASDGERSAQEAIRQGHAEDPARKLYIVGGPAVQENLTTLEDLYPSAIVTHHPSHVEGKDFWSVFVPGPAPAAAPGVSPGDPSDG
jgi:hypothetical protein